MKILYLGEPLPEWHLENIFEGELPKVEDFRGKPLLILIFSFGCPGCLGRAIPFANRVVYELGEQVNVIGIHSEFEPIDYSFEQFQKAKEEHYIRFPFFKDAVFTRTFYNYGAGGTPHWFLVDKDGNLVYSIFGSDPNNALLRLDYRIQELLTS